MSAILKWGLITGMVYIIFSLLGTLLGIQQGGSLGLGILSNTILMVVSFFTIYLGVKEVREDTTTEFFTMGQGFVTGFKIALIASVMAGVFTLIYQKFIDPEMMDRIMAQAEEKWDEMGVPEERRELGRKFQSYFTNSFFTSAVVMLQVIFWGVIKSLVAGAILKKNPPTMLSA